MHFSTLPIGVEAELVDVLFNAHDFDKLRELARGRAIQGYADEQHRRNWEAVGLLINFEATTAALGSISGDEKALLWNIRDKLTEDRRRERRIPEATAEQLCWIIQQFRAHWPHAQHPADGWSGDNNAWDATEFLELLIRRLAKDTSPAATTALSELIAGPKDGYTDLLRHSADLQRRARREINFPGITLDQLKAAIEERPPQTTGDLLAIVRSALARLQQELRGSDTDSIGKYFVTMAGPVTRTAVLTGSSRI
jgi:hypothetical protein